MAKAPAATRFKTTGFVRTWVENHDDRWSFTLTYVALALILSTTISLFWLVALLLAHMVLEWISLVRRGDRRNMIAKVLWHVKLDITLVLFALALGLYFDVLFGLLGLGALARTGTQVTARFLAWQKGLRTVLLSADDVALIAKAATSRIKGESGPTEVEAEEAEVSALQHPSQLSRLDYVTVGLALLFAGLILAAPLLTEHDVRAVTAILAAELHPWPR
jgi:hypothetical protein